MAADRRPAGVTISSKWGYVYTADWEVAADPPEVKHHDVDTFRRQLAETREHLGDWLGALPDPLGDAGQRRAGERRGAGRDGRLRPSRSGVSVSGTSQAETIDRAVSLGIFSAVQATWNLHERAAEARWRAPA